MSGLEKVLQSPVVQTLSGVGLLTSLLGGKKEAAAPTPAPVKAMPTADSEAVRKAKKKSVASQLGRGGRASTILTDAGSEKLGA